MNNEDILRLSKSEISKDEADYYKNEYLTLNAAFDIAIKNSIKKMNLKFGCIDTHDFDIKKDFQQRDMRLIISQNNHTYYLNLFNFKVFLNHFNNDIQEYILTDPILQLASFENKSGQIFFDLKTTILQKLNKITNQLNNEVSFNVLSEISIYDYDFKNDNEKSLIKIHFEINFVSNIKLFDELLNEFQTEINCVINYVPNEIVFGSHIKNILTPEEFNEIKEIRDKNGMEFAIFYKDIDNIILKNKLLDFVQNKSVFNSSCGFGFNDL